MEAGTWEGRNSKGGVRLHVRLPSLVHLLFSQNVALAAARAQCGLGGRRCGVLPTATGNRLTGADYTKFNWCDPFWSVRLF
jgi:hypothetical protein